MLLEFFFVFHINCYLHFWTSNFWLISKFWSSGVWKWSFVWNSTFWFNWWQNSSFASLTSLTTLQVFVVIFWPLTIQGWLCTIWGNCPLCCFTLLNSFSDSQMWCFWSIQIFSNSIFCTVFVFNWIISYGSKIRFFFKCTSYPFFILIVIFNFWNDFGVKITTNLTFLFFTKIKIIFCKSSTALYRTGIFRKITILVFWTFENQSRIIFILLALLFEKSGWFVVKVMWRRHSSVWLLIWFIIITNNRNFKLTDIFLNCVQISQIFIFCLGSIMIKSNEFFVRNLLFLFHLRRSFRLKEQILHLLLLLNIHTIDMLVLFWFNPSLKRFFIKFASI